MNIIRARQIHKVYDAQKTFCFLRFVFLRCKTSDEEFSRQSNPQEYDLVGPRDPNSNLRTMIFAKEANETRREQQLRLQKQALYSWHQTFWSSHNENFRESKKKFLDGRTKSKDESDQQSADELSVFYKDFLDKNYKLHSSYMWEWYRKNFKLLWPSFLVTLEQFTKSLHRKKY